MGLITGNNNVQQQMQTSYTDEQQRQLKVGLIVLKARRVWRLVCLAGFIISTIIGCYNVVGTNDSFALVIGVYALGWIFLYAVMLYIFLYILAARTIQFFLYLRDLFGGSKETRL